MGNGPRKNKYLKTSVAYELAMINFFSLLALVCRDETERCRGVDKGGGIKGFIPPPTKKLQQRHFFIMLHLHNFISKP